jgi:hypothetical protein
VLGLEEKIEQTSNHFDFSFWALELQASWAAA